MNEQIISGSETIRRARNLKLVPDAYFTLLFLTCDMRIGRCGELRKYVRVADGMMMRVGNYHVPLWGEAHNRRRSRPPTTA